MYAMELLLGASHAILTAVREMYLFQVTMLTTTITLAGLQARMLSSVRLTHQHFCQTQQPHSLKQL